MNRKELKSRLDSIFFPRSVAVIGASDVPGKWGNSIMTAILGWSYPGTVYPVNPNRKTIFGLTCYPSVLEIPEPVDLALFAIPARSVPAGLKDCIAKGIRAAVIISSGFKETGEEGAALEREIVDIARRGGLAFIGPNTMGVASAHHRFDAVFSPTAPEPGGLGIISQSGNIGIQIMKWVHHKDIGLAMYAGTGNEALLRSSDLLWYMGTRDEVKVVAMYIEGIPNGREFMEIASRVTRIKPVVVLKAGRSESGSQAAQSHTGSLAGSFASYRAMFTQSGINQVASPTDLLDVSASMSHLPIPCSNHVGVMTFGGGWGIITADECEESGLSLPPLPRSIIRDFDSLLPPYWNRRNPVDVVAEADPDMYLRIIGKLAEWDQTDAVIALGIVGRARFVEDFIESQERIDGKIFSRELKLSILRDQVRSEDRILTGIAAIQKQTGKPILVVALTEGGLSLRKTDAGPVITLSSPEEAVTIVSHLVRYGRYLNKLGLCQDRTTMQVRHLDRRQAPDPRRRIKTGARR
jgi:acyl-CoA synthetase (NDP forming)